MRSPTICALHQILGSSAESGAHACLLRHLRRCSRGFELPVSRFPLNRQSFRTYHLPQVTSILPALSATMFGVSRCATYLYCSSVFWGALFGEWLCLLTYLVLVFFGRRCVVCSCVCYLYSSCVFWATLFGVWLCLFLILFSCFFWGGWVRKWFSLLWKLLRIMRIVLI